MLFTGLKDDYFKCDFLFYSKGENGELSKCDSCKIDAVNKRKEIFQM
jgi:hypothetical protein